MKTKNYLTTAAEKDEMRESSLNLVEDLALILDVSVENPEIRSVQLLANVTGIPTKIGRWLQQVALLNFLLQS